MKHVYLISAALVILMCAGCRHPGANGKVYSDTPEGRTARYVHENCYTEMHFDAHPHWDRAYGRLSSTKAFTIYRCPNDEDIVIFADQEQP